MSEIRLLVFARAPVAGSVKTRLIPALGDDGAAALHRHLLAHQLQQTRGAMPIELWCTPDSCDPFFQALAEQHGASLHTQQGGDLGERMHHALADALHRSDGAVLIGSDIPLIDAAVLHAARGALRQNAAVLLPTDDGGYGLIGLRRADHRLFDGVAWGTPQVMEATRARLRLCKVHWAELPTLWDVDRPDDLARLRRLPGWDSLVAELLK
jgi:hypothetical protein